MLTNKYVNEHCLCPARARLFLRACHAPVCDVTHASTHASTHDTTASSELSRHNIVPMFSSLLQKQAASRLPQPSHASPSASRVALLPVCNRGRGAVSTSYATSSAVGMERVTADVPAFQKLKEQEMLMPLPREVEGLVDDPNVHNPLQRLERLGTGWFGVVMEHDGVLFQDGTELHHEVRMREWGVCMREGQPQRPRVPRATHQSLTN